MTALSLSTEELRQLKVALAAGDLRAPLTAKSLGAINFSRLLGRCDLLLGLDAEKLSTLIDVLLDERAGHPVPPELVWTGPEGAAATARDTEVIVRQLFVAARREVILGGYSFDHGADILAPLHAVMRDHGVRTLMFVDIPGKARVPAELESYANDRIRSLLINIWPFGEPRPDVYYDPRTASPAENASLHAKCIVVDDETALLTSANFTNRGQTRNIESGVLLRDPAFARQLADHWRGLIRGGRASRHVGDGSA